MGVHWRDHSGGGGHDDGSPITVTSVREGGREGKGWKFRKGRERKRGNGRERKRFRRGGRREIWERERERVGTKGKEREKGEGVRVGFFW